MNRLPMLWVNADNQKTGSIPTAYIGATKKQAEQSCKSCPLLKVGCYAWTGTVNMAFSGMVKTYTHDKSRYSFDSMFSKRNKRAKAIRIAALGDPVSANRAELWYAIGKAKRAGLSTLGYTHMWHKRDARDLKADFLASCPAKGGNADEAINKGWRPAQVIPWYTPGIYYQTRAGNKLLICPVQRGIDTTCDKCRLCALDHKAWRSAKFQGIAFLDHAPKARAEKRRFE